ncbi:hypothetical protein CASFOL_021675 [Castilleja foliolosa]|uniref:Uncharacterized protein n=1 Tax=Castilleja foliolosa TaxID=1961234 RepID=A0ABD3CZA0_9LAMI
MPEKAANLGWVLGPSPKIQWWFKILMMGVFLGILIVWGIDGLNMNTLHKDFPHNPVLNKTHDISSFTPQVSKNSTKAPNLINPWISSAFEPNYSSNLLAKWLIPGGEPCKDSKTVDIRFVPSLDNENRKKIELSTGIIYEFVFQALDETGEPHCLGGDYFETDLSGEKWKSRPPITDMGNGNYKFSLQVHPDFSGDYNLTIILLYRHYEGLRFSPARFAFDSILRVIPVKFAKSLSKLPVLKQCKWSDYTKDVWSGRWTRHAKNDSCHISNDGRYRCQDRNFPCQSPWCKGPFGCIREQQMGVFDSLLVQIILGPRSLEMFAKSLDFLVGIFDMNITNPKNRAQTVRFTSIFNGHPNYTGNYQGLNSLTDPKYRDLLKGYFSHNKVPDTLIMNSGLHDGVYWSNIRNFIKGADYAGQFWAEVMEGVNRNGLSRPEIIYRTTVTTGGHARKLALNRHKMEVFNGVVLDKLRKYGVVDRVIDGFDMTYPWHYDNRCNDGVHYGRAPLKMRWRDGEIGHQYFVDLMLGHVLINAVC